MDGSEHTQPESLEIAEVVSAFGVRGWLKLHARNSASTHIMSNTDLWCSKADGSAPFPIHVQQARRHGKGWIISVDGCADRNSAKQYAGATLSVPLKELQDPGEGRYYWHQLSGLAVWSEKGWADQSKEVLLGRVDYLFQTGANDVVVVVPDSPNQDKQRILIPWVRHEIISEVNLEKGWIKVKWGEQS